MRKLDKERIQENFEIVLLCSIFAISLVGVNPPL